MAEGEQRRRNSDREEALELRILARMGKDLSDTRHMLRNDIDALSKKMEVRELQHVTEEAKHTEQYRSLSTDVRDLREDIAAVEAHTAAIEKDMMPRLAELEAEHLAAEKIGDVKRWLITTFISLAAVILVAAGLIIGLAH